MSSGEAWNTRTSLASRSQTTVGFRPPSHSLTGMVERRHFSALSQAAGSESTGDAMTIRARPWQIVLEPCRYSDLLYGHAEHHRWSLAQTSGSAGPILGSLEAAPRSLRSSSDTGALHSQPALRRPQPILTHAHVQSGPAGLLFFPPRLRASNGGLPRLCSDDRNGPRGTFSRTTQSRGAANGGAYPDPKGWVSASAEREVIAIEDSTELSRSSSANSILAKLRAGRLRITPRQEDKKMASKATRSMEATINRLALDKAGYNPPPVASVDRPRPSPSPPLSPAPSEPNGRA